VVKPAPSARHSVFVGGNRIRRPVLEALERAEVVGFHVERRTIAVLDGERRIRLTVLDGDGVALHEGVTLGPSQCISGMVVRMRFRRCLMLIRSPERLEVKGTPQALTPPAVTSGREIAPSKY
jgi:hypothetical protein